MSDVVIQRIDKPSRPGKKPKGVTLRRVTGADGQKVTIRAIDANSPNFGEEFLYVFGRNVAAARKENKELLGTLSGVQKRK